MIRFLTSGESHGPGLQVIVEGLPAGLPVNKAFLKSELSRRRRGYGRGPRMKIEKDLLSLWGGVRNGLSTGAPVGMILENTEWEQWSQVLHPLETDPDATEAKRVSFPRPGHADLPGAFKYRHRDARDVLERASARSTASLTLAGTLARILLKQLGVAVRGAVTSIGGVSVNPPENENEWTRAMSSSMGLPRDKEKEPVIREIESAARDGETLGGTFLLSAIGLPPGIGTYVHWDRRLDGRLAGAIMAIPAIKGVEVGGGFSLASMKGSSSLDEILPSGSSWTRTGNLSGGIEGGMTNGEEILVTAAMKPIPTLKKPLRSVDISTGKAMTAAYERSDTCAVPAACVVGEAMMAWVLGEMVTEQFGGDNLEELKAGFQKSLERREHFFHE